MSIYNCIAQVVPSVLPIGSVMVRGITSCMVTGSLSASLGLINNHVVLVSNIADIANPWVLIGNTKNHVAYLCHLVSISQSSLLTLSLPARSVSLLLQIHTYITQLCLLITMLELLVRSLLIVLRLIWCIQTVFGYVSNHPAVVICKVLDGLYQGGTATSTQGAYNIVLQTEISVDGIANTFGVRVYTQIV